MAKGQLPKAYIRVDPNLDQTHPDPGAFVRLLCAAARQPRRGRFKTRQLAELILGRRLVAALLLRRDLVDREGVLEVDGWDIWQEGDFTVGERMRRYRARHSGVTDTVTDTVTLPSPPSETARQQGSRNGERTTATDSGPLRGPAPGEREPPPTEATPAEARSRALSVLGPPPWSREACDDWILRFGGTAPGGQIGKALKPLVVAHGWTEVRVAWRGYLAQVEAEFASASRFASTYGRWSGTVLSPQARPGKPTAAEVTVRSVNAVLAREAAKGEK